ncbi:LysM peptidoglycan-binding domain-containing protein [Nitrosococcus watsonii]|uniref:Peptidoglycan-binding lysin domain protein n=1 Tax=Nitrosococcus watsoni (strain C-113) TaxID=105559 RepID=D8KA30_NITWC|nr:LysM peptidoglycan-binding domain-containing protein [Nitrosococcus watsonii]ADJ29388.1 Peptidoglycan-binding lysin domain protein [Nitrosococcus watsonii C-113]
MKAYLSLISTLTGLKNTTVGVMMDHSRSNVHNYYRRANHKPFGCGPTRSYGGILSVVIVLLLIVILAAGAVWTYLGRQGEEVKVTNQENKALAPQASATKSAEPESTDELAANDKKYTLATNEQEATLKEEKDDFAAILEELNREEEKAESEKPGESSPQLARDKMPAQTVPKQTEPTSHEENSFEPAPKKPYERGKVPTAEELENTESFRSQSSESSPLQTEQPEPSGIGQKGEEASTERPKSIGLPSTPPEQPKPSGMDQRGEEINSKSVTIQRGDSLSSLAARVYGDANKWRVIYEANQDKIKNPDQLLVGTKLTIPASK